jgi:hypothetical protein
VKKEINPLDEERFSDIYLIDPEIEGRIKEIIESPECQDILNRARESGSTLSLLSEIVPDKKVHPFKRMREKVRPFYEGREYQSKEDYLQYLKQVYGFLQTPMEVPPGRLISLFYPGMKKNWEPSDDVACELLSRFYVEATLISDLSEEQWDEIAISENPEFSLNKILFKTEFKEDFEEFLRTIPWIVSYDAYGSPGLDIIWRSAPGAELPKKPFAVGDRFVKKLVQRSQRKRAYTILWDDGERIPIKGKKQILAKIEEEGEAKLDTFVGLSKIEQDFVVHQHIVIWKNPGTVRYEEASRLLKLIYLRPSKYLCVIREEALPLEIPFLKRKKTGM